MGRTRRGPARHKTRPAGESFAFLRSLANRKDLGYLLELCAGISAIAGYVEVPDPLATRFHYQISRIVLDAVLRSTAQTDFSAPIRPADIYKVVNTAIDVTYDPEASRRIANSSGSPSAHLELKRFLAQLGHVQNAPFEDHPVLAAGRTFQLYEHVPTVHRAEIESRVPGAQQALDIPISDLLGLSVKEAAEVYLLLLNLYAERWSRVVKRLPDGEARLGATIEKLDQLAVDQYWSFTVDTFPERHRGAVGAFLSVFARTPTQHRFIIESGTPYDIGHLSCRMLSVDRYPVVSLPSDRYIMPNITVFRKAFSPVIDFSLMEAYGNRGLDELYNQIRGASLEIYIEQLIADRLPTTVLIPETTYRSSDGDVRSPDVCILDLDDRTLIAIEAKARRLSPKAAAQVRDGDLDQNFGPSYDAIRRLPGKIDDLYRVVEFERYRDDLRRIPRERSVLVSVVPTTLFFHDELEPLRARLDPNHPLTGLAEPFCFLDLFVFERAVELARKHGAPLGQLLREHYEDAQSTDPNTTSARLFRAREEPEPSEAFAWRW